jgi:orotate phosphoribosyltransferase
MRDGDRLTKEQIAQKLHDKGCLYAPEEGYHFVGIGGKHLSGYCNIDPALPDVNFIAKLTQQLVEHFKDDDIDTVFAPAIGAIPMAQWGPYYLEKSTGKPVLGVWADKVKPRGFVIERNGFREAIAGKRVLILEDIINQMFSVRELVRMAQELGAEVVGVGGIMVKDDATAEKIGVPKLALMYEYSYDAWEASKCRLCKNKVPIVTDAALGHGAEFRELHPDYAGGYIKIEDKVAPAGARSN